MTEDKKTQDLKGKDVIKDNKTETTEESQEETKEKYFNKDEVVRMLKFLFFSISAGVIQIGSFTLLNELVKWSYWPSYLISLTLSVLWNFTLNRKFTFKSAANIPLAMLKVFGFYLVFTPLSTLGGDALTNAGWNEYLVLGITMVLNFVLEYLFCKFFVYKDNINTATKKEESK